MYYEQLTIFSDAIEHDIGYAGKYGAKGEKRAPKQKPTPEQIEKQNQKNRETRLKRLIHHNFTPEDLWVTLKYPKGTRKSVKELKKDFTGFIRRLSYQYKKRGVSLKWVARKEIGARGGLHVHILVNRIPKEDTDLIIRKAWGNPIWHTTLFSQGGYEALAEYITKKPSGQVKGQLSLFPEDEQDELISYSRSRNLEEPKTERKEYSRRTVKKIIEALQSGDYMACATKGHYIDKDSIRIGVNPFTGLSYIHYAEYRLDMPPEYWGGPLPWEET